MSVRPDYLPLALVAAIAGCAARAGEESSLRPDDPPGTVHLKVDPESIRAFRSPERQVHVSGTARASVSPDAAEISVGVSTAKPTAREAVSANNATMAALMEALKRRGVAAKDIRTSYVGITPQYANQLEPPRAGLPPEMTAPKVVGYEASNTLAVTTRDLPRIGELLDAALGAGSNQLHGLSFRVEGREAVLAGLRDKAFEDARAKAEVYAKRAGLALGPVAQVAENDGGWSAPMAPGGGYPMMAPAPMAPGAPMPVSPGEQDVALSVSVSFELRPAR